MALEVRALFEFYGYVLTLPLMQQMPKGDGHPVLVLPGFGTGDWYMLPLRLFLRSRGYSAQSWGLGMNLGYGEDLAVKLGRRLREIYERHGRPVSLIGWSLGGIYAREMARARPERVRFVITLGSPFTGSPKGTNIWRLYEYVSGHRLDKRDPDMVSMMQVPPPVPTTSIYSKTDGVAARHCCIERTAPLCENIAVPGSHCGLAHNPIVLWALADRLAQDEENWRPFQRTTRLRRLCYGKPCMSA
jgi:hypothetical protein